MSNPVETLRLTWADVEAWVEHGLLTPPQAIAIRRHLEASGPVAERRQAGLEQRKGLNLVTIAYYFGGFMILLAYTIFMGLQWESVGAGGQITISAVTMALLWGLGAWLRRAGFTRAGGLLIFAGTGITPLLVYTLQRALGLWPDSAYAYGGDDFAYRDFYRYIASTWITLEVVSIVVAVISLWLTRFSLISLLIAFWTWFFSMDVLRLVTGSAPFSWGNEIQWLSVVLGVGMLALGILLQRRARQDYSFWLYLFGHVVILGHLSALTLEREGWLGLMYLLTYLAFVIGSVWLQRRVFLVFGALGCYGYVSYLAFRVFDGALGFTFGLASAGLLIVLTAVGYQKYVRPWLERHFHPQSATVQA